MKQDIYTFTKGDNDLVFTFFSIGKRGVIPKIVVFEYIKPNTYNLAFGDFDISTDTFNDEIVSNNGDVKKVLATVVAILLHFFVIQPIAKVYIKGSNTIRTNLYQRIIKTYAAEYNDFLKIEGFLEGKLNSELLDLSKNYSQFSITKI